MKTLLFYRQHSVEWLVGGRSGCLSNCSFRLQIFSLFLSILLESSSLSKESKEVPWIVGVRLSNVGSCTKLYLDSKRLTT